MAAAFAAVVLGAGAGCGGGGDHQGAPQGAAGSTPPDGSAGMTCGAAAAVTDPCAMVATGTITACGHAADRFGETASLANVGSCCRHDLLQLFIQTFDCLVERLAGVAGL